MAKIDEHDKTIHSTTVIVEMEALDGWAISDADAQYLNALRELEEQTFKYPEWYEGTILVRETYWADYVRLHEDYRVPSTLPLDILSAIDWEKVGLRYRWVPVKFKNTQYRMILGRI